MPSNFTLNLSSQRLSDCELTPRLVRLIAYSNIAIILAVAILAGDLNQSSWWLPVTAIAYPVISHIFTRGLNRRYASNVGSTLILIDTIILGFAVVLSEFDPAISLFIFLIVSVGTVTVKGITGWMISQCTFLLGVIAGLVVIGPPAGLPEAPSIATLMVGIGCTTLFSSALGYFSHQQRKALIDIQTQLNNRQKETANLSRKLSKYLPPQVWGSIFSGQTEVKLETQRKKLTVFFSDIKGFAEISEELQPEALTDVLNSYFNEMSRIALAYGGTIDKFVGDAILIFFGDPTSRGQKQDAIACASMALEMRKRMKLLRQQWRKQGISKPLQVRMGINTGYCTVGNFGAETRMDYTIIGREVNLASRLESVAQPGEILVSEPTYNLVRDVIMCRDRGQINVKGFSKTVPLFEIVDHRKELGASQSFLECEMDGFTMFVDIDKIRNYDKDTVIEALEEAAQRIRDKLIV